LDTVAIDPIEALDRVDMGSARPFPLGAGASSNIVEIVADDEDDLVVLAHPSAA
jgi:hypothetical protein